MSIRENDFKMIEALVQHMNEQIHHLAHHCQSPMAQILCDELKGSVRKITVLLGQPEAPVTSGAMPSPLPVPPPPSPFEAALDPGFSPSRKSEISQVSAKKKTLFLIDDDKDAQKVLGYMFERKSDFRVVSYLDPLQAWADIKANPPDLILMDLMMPGISGVELLKQIRLVPQLHSVKILIGSSKSFDKDRIEVLKAGANDFIAKPYNFTELLLRLTKLAS